MSRLTPARSSKSIPHAGSYTASTAVSEAALNAADLEGGLAIAQVGDLGADRHPRPLSADAPTEIYAGWPQILDRVWKTVLETGESLTTPIAALLHRRHGWPRPGAGQIAQRATSGRRRCHEYLAGSIREPSVIAVVDTARR